MSFDHDDFLENVREAREYLVDFEKEARLDYDFAALRQWEDEDKEAMKAKGKPALTFDRTRPILEALAGSEITNRYAGRFLTRDPEVNSLGRVASEGLSRVTEFIQDSGDFEQHESRSFWDCLCCGVGALGQSIEYDEDSDGRILNKRVPIWEMGWDTTSVEPNMADARWILRDRWVDEDELGSLFGQQYVDTIVKMAAGSGGSGGPTLWASVKSAFNKKIKDDRHAYDLRKRGERYYDVKQRRIRLWELQRMERRYATMIYTPDVDNIDDIFEALKIGAPVPELEVLVKKEDVGSELERFEELVATINAELPEEAMKLDRPETVEDFPVRKYYRSWHTWGEEIDSEEIAVKSFTYEFLTAFEDWKAPGLRYFFGIMRPMRDPQRYANKFLSHMVYQWASNPKGGLIAEKDLFENPEKAMEQWASPTGILWAEAGGLQHSKPRFVHLTQQASMSGVEGLLSHAMNAVPSAAGVSEAYFVGSAGDLKRTAAEGIQSIQEQSLKTQANPFDSLRLYRKRITRKLFRYVEQFWDEERLAALLGGENAKEIAALILSGDLDLHYEVKVEEVSASSNEKQAVFKMIVEANLMPQMMSQGVPLPPEFADFFPIPNQAAAKLKVALEKVWNLQMTSLEFQKMQLDMQMQGQVPGGDPQAPGAQPPSNDSVQ